VLGVEKGWNLLKIKGNDGLPPRKSGDA